MLLYPGHIQPGSKVTLHFTIRATDGTVMESSVGDEPQTFVMGDGTLLEGFELALVSLKAGERQTITLRPDQAYGPRDPDALTVLPRGHFPPKLAIEPGAMVVFTTAEGHEVPGRVLGLRGDAVEVDFNHPLAGQEVVLEVEILEVVDPVFEEE
ncbi:MAG: peptidylprolyl isomerase [Gammaproteobacteria bacterium]